MKKTRKWVIIILIIAMVGSLVPTVAGLFVNFDKINKEVKPVAQNHKIENSIDLNEAMLKPIKTLITTVYYDKGEYSDYKSVLLKPEKAWDKASFDDIRKGTTAKDYFKFDADSPESMMKHLIAVKKADKVIVYYLKDINSQEQMKNSKTWTLVDKSGTWLIDN